GDTASVVPRMAPGAIAPRVSRFVTQAGNGPSAVFSPWLQTAALPGTTRIAMEPLPKAVGASPATREAVVPVEPKARAPSDNRLARPTEHGELARFNQRPMTLARRSATTQIATVFPTRGAHAPTDSRACAAPQQR